MNLQTLADEAQIVSPVVLIAGLFVGIDQVRQLRSQRRDASAIELIRSIQAPTLEEHADASNVSFALHDGFGKYGGIDENDPAIVTLRVSHEVVDLHRAESALRGEFAYPMLTRGRLVGALVLGPKRSGESYAPDESAAIA